MVYRYRYVQHWVMPVHLYFTSTTYYSPAKIYTIATILSMLIMLLLSFLHLQKYPILQNIFTTMLLAQWLYNTGIWIPSFVNMSVSIMISRICIDYEVWHLWFLLTFFKFYKSQSPWFFVVMHMTSHIPFSIFLDCNVP